MWLNLIKLLNSKYTTDEPCTSAIFLKITFAEDLKSALDLIYFSLLNVIFILHGVLQVM